MGSSRGKDRKLDSFYENCCKKSTAPLKLFSSFYLTSLNFHLSLHLMLCFEQIKLLFAAEKKVCDEIFKSYDNLRDQCFAEVTGTSVIMLLSFGDAIAKSKRSPEKLFVLLDMYEVMRELQPEVWWNYLVVHVPTFSSFAHKILWKWKVCNNFKVWSDFTSDHEAV